jgi:hypothetical protein
MAVKIIDFDKIDNWESELTEVLSPYVSKSVREEIEVVGSSFEYIDDARDLLLKQTNCNAVIDATLEWIRSSHIAAYHGTRLTDEEVTSVRANGLVPLKAEDRRQRLTRALSKHPDWSKVANQLDEAIHDIGFKNQAGSRENQVHLTLSKADVTGGLNYYATQGSEFDWHVAHRLLGDEGQRLIALDGKSTVVQVVLPGSVALGAAHPFFDVYQVRSSGEVPNIVSQLLMFWAHRLAHPNFQRGSFVVDSCMMFRSLVPADWIVDIETLSE